MRFTSLFHRHIKLVWTVNTILAIGLFFMMWSNSYWFLSISNQERVKDFDGAIMPLAFVPDWKKSDYIERRLTLDYDTISQEDLIPLPKWGDVHKDFNALFTYITAYMWAYLDENREVGAWSHAGTDIRAPMHTPVFAIWNGLVVKVRNDPDNKYVVIEHRNVSYDGTVWKYYSSYLHLDSVNVLAWDIVTKWSFVGKVGMSGITTTPHLHIQVDTQSAPFHPYWPFSMEEAWESGLDFFQAVTEGLNKDRLVRYTVDPIDFILNSTSIDGSKKIVKEIISTEDIKIPTIENHFSDVDENDSWYDAIMYFSDKWVLSGYGSWEFKPNKTIIRSELLGIVLKALNIQPHGEILVGIFRDVPPEHWVNPLITESVKRKIITTDRPVFEPNRDVTRSEFLAILALAARTDFEKIPQKSWSDIPSGHWSQKYADFADYYNLFDDLENKQFNPNGPVSRAEIAEAMYRYLKNTGKL